MTIVSLTVGKFNDGSEGSLQWALVQYTGTIWVWVYLLPGIIQQCSYIFPAVSNSLCWISLLCQCISKKYNLMNHWWANKLEISETSISKKCLIWANSSVIFSIKFQWLCQLLSYCLTASSQPSHTQLWEDGLGLCKLHVCFALVSMLHLAYRKH